MISVELLSFYSQLHRVWKSNSISDTKLIRFPSFFFSSLFIQRLSKIDRNYHGNSIILPICAIRRLILMRQGKRGWKDFSKDTHVPMSVHVVVGELDFLEGNDLLSELLARERRIRMDVEPGWRRRICLSGHQPAAPVICVPISFIVDRYDVHQDCISAVRLQSVKWDTTRREHPPAQTRIYHRSIENP